MRANMLYICSSPSTYTLFYFQVEDPQDKRFGALYSRNCKKSSKDERHLRAVGWKRETSSCSGCKNQRKKCTEKCVLAPYFPQNDPQKFLLVHKVFGKGHVAKLLQGIPAKQRGDAVSSMVYEARARVRDPVHGCVGVIKDLQNELAELQLQLESTKVELANIRLQCANFSILITGYEEVLHPNFYTAAVQEIVLDDADSLQLWEPLWSYSSK